jgi:hypothetical protein
MQDKPCVYCLSVVLITGSGITSEGRTERTHSWWILRIKRQMLQRANGIQALSDEMSPRSETCFRSKSAVQHETRSDSSEHSLNSLFFWQFRASQSVSITFWRFRDRNSTTTSIVSTQILHCFPHSLQILIPGYFPLQCTGSSLNTSRRKISTVSDASSLNNLLSIRDIFMWPM